MKGGKSKLGGVPVGPEKVLDDEKNRGGGGAISET